jgi:hypothetical protein
MKFLEEQLKLNKWNFAARVALPILILIWVLAVACNYFTFFGSKNIRADFNEKSPYLSLFSPQDRLGAKECLSGDCYQIMLGEPVYFDVITPRRYANGSVEIKFKTENQPIVDLGVAVGSDISAMKLFPLSNQIIENLATDPTWQTIQEGDLYLFQKEKKFASIADFFATMPYHAKIAFFNYDYVYDFQLPEYQPQTERQSWPVFTRGNQNLFFYVKNEPLFIELKLADLNRKLGADEIKISLFNVKTGEQLWSQTVSDATVEADEKLIDEISQTIDLKDPKTGVLRLEIIAPDDVALKEITTASTKFVFDKKILLLSRAEINKLWPKLKLNDLTMYTEGKTVFMQAFETDGLQTVTINNQKIDLKERITIYKNKSDAIGAKTMVLPERGVLLQSDGVIALAPANYFNHQPYNFRAVIRPEENDFDYVLARYDKPEETADGWLIARLPIDMTDAYYNKRQVKFMLSLPGIENNQGIVYLTDLKFNFKP